MTSTLAPRDSLPTAKRTFRFGLRAQTLIGLILAFVLSFGLLGLALVRVTERGRALDRARDHRAAARAVATLYASGAGSRHERFVRAADSVLGVAGVRGVELIAQDLEPDVRGVVGLGHAVEAASGSERLRLWVRPPDPSTGVPVSRLLLLYVAVTGGGVLLLTYFTLTTLVVRPVGALTRAAQRMASGDLQTTAPERGSAELERLARNFNRMGRQLADDRAALEDKIHELVRTTEELEQAQEQVLRSERLASVGRLAAGLAHEVGNPLAAIRGLLEIAAEEEDTADRQEYLTRAQDETERISRIIRDLLDFARQGREPADGSAGADLAEVARDAIRLAVARDKTVHFELEASEGVPLADMDPDRALQVVLNLLLNAADAAGEGGVVVVEVGRADDQVSLRVLDDGPGIDPAVIDQLFEPFVTTKPVGEGTGLGLAVCHTLVERAGGSLHATNREPGGACFQLRLPIR